MFNVEMFWNFDTGMQQSIYSAFYLILPDFFFQ